jgi:hypothetical protein
MMAIAELRQLTISKYAATSVWKTPQALAAYLKSALQSYGEAEYEFYLRESEYLDGVVHIANGLDFVTSALDSTTAHPAVLDHVSWFWKGWHKFIERDGLSAHLRAAWLEVLNRLEQSGMAGSQFDGLPVIDYSLNALVDPKVGPDEAEFRAVFPVWLASQHSPTHTATVAEFLARVRVRDNQAKVYSHPLVRAAAFEQRE